MRSTGSSGLLVAALVCLAAGWGSPAGATTFTVTPVHVFLSQQTKSVLLTLRNTSDQPLRFQLSVFAWDQDPQGELQLAPTTDIVFFPPLLSLASGEQRRVRIGAVTPPGTAEKTYRLFVEELPAPAGSPPSAGGEVKVLTRLGIPIFLQPAQPVFGGRIENLVVREGRIAFVLRNTGSVHFVANVMRLSGYDAGGNKMLEGTLEGWYVLAGGLRRFHLAVPKDKCGDLRMVSVEAETERGVITERVEVPPDACGP